ncbi:hypothetical protein QW060_21510 [Myroides ceti]|uniref:Uncharacterized protein n=1 Tax=Paenimyroides ceti TaxID=395087 RepID=A0ABT8D263_9FLAO|nr:hypothetical protein [Paenimyroides ceti]MDN3709555.1 hypothetical protein [Paenimyroides ceti]
MKKIIYFFFCFFLFYPIIVDAHNIEREKEKPYISDNKRDFSFYAPLNDDCPEAVTLTVNTSHECVISFSSNFQEQRLQDCLILVQVCQMMTSGLNLLLYHQYRLLPFQMLQEMRQ